MDSFPKNWNGLRLCFVLSWVTGAVLLCCSWAHGTEDIKFVHVSCNYSGIDTRIRFRRVFQGLVYSQGNYFNPNCRYVSPRIGTKDVSLFLPPTDCGTFIQEVDTDIYIFSTIIVQKHRILETGLDLVRNVSCKLPRPDSYRKQEFYHSTHPFHYTNAEFESWMEFQRGSDVIGVDIPNKLLVGDELLMVIHLKDGGVFEDLQVERCWAYDEEAILLSRYAIKLYDIHTCKPSEWIKGFNLTKGTDHVSDLKAYGIISAFKFPISKNVHFTCSIQVCRSFCNRDCPAFSSDESSSSAGRYKRSDLDEIPGKSIRTRQKLMKATIKALGVKLLEKNRENLSENASFNRRASSAKNTSVNYKNSKKPRLTKDNVTWTELPAIDMYYFNLTNNLIVFTDHEYNFPQKLQTASNDPAYCVPRIRFNLVTAVMSLITFFLIITCTGLIFYLRKEKRKNNIDNFLLYSLY